MNSPPVPNKNMDYKVWLIGFLVFLSVFAGVGFALAIDKPTNLDLPDISIEQVLQNIFNLVAGIVAAVAALVIIIGGIMWMTAGGDEERVTKARKTILAAIIGLIIVGAAVGIVTFVLRIFASAPILNFPVVLAGNGGGLGNESGGGLGNETRIQNPLKARSFTELFVGIANWLAGIIASVAVLVIIFGGFQYLTSGGNEEKIAQARRTIQWAIIGLIIVIMSWSLLKTILSILGVE